MSAFERWLGSPLRQLALALPAAALVALLSTTQLYLNWRSRGFEASFHRLLAAEGVEWGLWACLVPVVVALDRRLEARPPRRALAVHLAVALAWSLVLNLALSLLTRTVDPAAAPSLARVYLDRALLRLPSAIAVYLFLSGALWLVKSLVRQERLRRDLAEAELRNLRAQLQPHFLFNTLHTVASRVRSDDRDGAVRTLVGLGDLLRRSLRHAERDVVPLHEEVSFLRTYLDIQRARFGERLDARVDVGPGLDSVAIPFLLLQPLVENAIRHGLDLDSEPGRVAVSIRGRGRGLRIVVDDLPGDGVRSRERAALPPGPPPRRPETPGAEANGFGMGLENLRGRLVALYGHDQRFSLRRLPDGGTRVEIEIPLREEDDV